jgi:hypothetical protein
MVFHVSASYMIPTRQGFELYSKRIIRHE